MENNRIFEGAYEATSKTRNAATIVFTVTSAGILLFNGFPYASLGALVGGVAGKQFSDYIIRRL